MFHLCRSFTEGKENSTEDLEKKDEEQEVPEYLQLHHMVVRKIGEICRIVNQVRTTEDTEIHKINWRCKKLLQVKYVNYAVCCNRFFGVQWRGN